VSRKPESYIVAQHVFESPAVSVSWPLRRFADQDHCRPHGTNVGISVIAGGTYGPFAMPLKRTASDPAKDIKRSRSASPSEDALRQGGSIAREPFLLTQPFRGAR